MPILMKTVCLTEAHTTWSSLKQEIILQGLCSLLMLLVILSALSGTVADPDLWGYMAFGRLFWETGRFPYHDTLAYVPTLNVWVYHEWLTGPRFGWFTLLPGGGK